MGKTSVVVSGGFAICFGLILLFTLGCRSEDSTQKYRLPSKYSVAGTAEINKDSRTNAESYSIAAAAMAKAYSEAADEIFKGMAGISNEYAKDINTVTEFSQAAMDSYTDGLSNSMNKYAQAILYGYDAAFFLVNGISDKRASSFFLRRDVSPTCGLPENSSDNNIASADYDNIFGYIGFMPYRDFGILIDAVEGRIGNGSYIISNTVEGSQEHIKINEALSLNSGATKNEAMDAFNALNVKARLLMVKKIEQANRDNAEGSGLNQSRNTIVDSCNKMVESFKTSAPGSLYDEKDVDSDKSKVGYLLKAIGQDPESLVSSKMGLFANGISASEGTISTMVGCIVSGKNYSSMNIMKPSTEVGDEDAKTLLTNMMNSTYKDIMDISKIRDSFKAYTLKEANELYANGIVSTGQDGSVDIRIPEKNCARFLNKPTNNKSFRAPDFGSTDSLVLMNGYLPEIYFNLDLIPEGFSIGVEYVNVNRLTQKLVDVPSESNMAITTLLHPANIDLKPEQDRDFMAFVNPLMPGVEISYEIKGGDKWEQAGKPVTNDSGYVEFFMPASPDETEDSLVIKSGKEIEKTFKFKL